MELKGIDDALAAGARISIVQDPERQMASDETLSKGWQEPQPLPPLLPPVPRFPSDMLPNALRPMVIDIAERMQVPLDFIAIPLVVAIASVIGRQCGIAPKRFDDWVVIVNTYGAVIAPPAAKKSPAMKAALAPLQILESEAREAFEAKRICTAVELEVIETRTKEVRAAIKAATKQGSDDEIKELKASLSNLMQQAASIQPRERRFKTSDVTVEKLAEMLSVNQNGLLIEIDELIGWLKNMEKPGHETDRALMLMAWNGYSSFTVDRISRGTTHIAGLCISVIGGIQPTTLQEYFKSQLKDGSGNDGLLQRFQLAVYPDIPKNYEHIDRKPNIEVQNRVNLLFQQLRSIQTTDFDIEPIAGSGNVPVFRFDAEAQTFFNNWLITLERRLRSGDFNSPLIESHIAKYRSLFPSLALIFEIVEMLDQRSLGGKVSIESAMLAEQWCTFLEAHANRIYSKAAEDKINSAHALAQKIRIGKIKDGHTIREIYRPHWSNLDEKEKVESALAVLLEAEWIRKDTIHPRSGKGAPSEVIRINPLLAYSSYLGKSESPSQLRSENVNNPQDKKLKKKKIKNPSTDQR